MSEGGFLQTIKSYLPERWTKSRPLVPVLREQAQKLREELEGRMSREDVRWSWMEEVASPTPSQLDQ